MLKVIVGDENDEKPKFESSSPYRAIVKEGEPKGRPLIFTVAKCFILSYYKYRLLNHMRYESSLKINYRRFFAILLLCCWITHSKLFYVHRA